MATITYRGTELQPTDKSMRFDILHGLDELPEYRGRDTIVPAREGRIRRNRVADRRLIELVGWVNGNGASLALRQAAYRATVNTLGSVLAPGTAAGTLILTGPYMGIGSGTTYTTTATFVNLVAGDLVAGHFRRFNIVLEAVEDTDWTVA